MAGRACSSMSAGAGGASAAQPRPSGFSFSVVLAAYDTRRGQAEGREAEKLLAFYPPTAPGVTQSSIAGLAQALTMFAGTFNKESPFHVMHAAAHIWVMYHAEPDLWLLAVVGRALVGPNCQPSALTGLLRALHGSIVLLHGLLSTQLEQDPSGVRVRMRLQPLLQEAAGSLLQPDPAGLWALSCPLGLTGGVPLLPVSPAAFTRLQSIVNSLLVCRLYGSRPVCGVLVAWQTCLLWSSLGSADTAALHTLAVRALEPAAREGSRHKTWRRTILVSPQAAAPPQASPQAGGAPSSSPPLPQSTRPSSTTGGGGGGAPPTADAAAGSDGGSLQADCMSLASPATWHARADGMLLPVWLPDAGAGSGPGCSALPQVWLQSGSEPARLMAWHSGPLLFLLLLEPHGPAATRCAPVTSGLSEVVSGPAAALAASLAAELPPKHLWHVKGLRYLYQDRLTAAVRASPLRKVATLAPASLRLAAEARQWTALEATAAADPTAPLLSDDAAAGRAADGSSSSGGGGDGGMQQQQQQLAGGSDGGASGGGGAAGRAAAAAWEAFAAGGEDADVEVVVRGSNDAWVVGRSTAAGRQLTVVVEGEREGMGGVMRRVQAYCDSQCPGVFDGLA